jgi:MFS family permease
MPLWSLSATEAGVMASALAFGYMLAVPVLTTLTDRIDARLVLAAGSAVSGFATIGFGVFAQGLVSATLIWGIAGIGFAGAYMPGLKALTDRLPPGDTSRIYNKMKSGEIEWTKIGARRLIKLPSLLRFLGVA